MTAVDVASSPTVTSSPSSTPSQRHAAMSSTILDTDPRLAKYRAELEARDKAEKAASEAENAALTAASAREKYEGQVEIIRNRITLKRAERFDKLQANPATNVEPISNEITILEQMLEDAIKLTRSAEPLSQKGNPPKARSPPPEIKELRESHRFGHKTLWKLLEFLFKVRSSLDDAKECEIESWMKQAAGDTWDAIASPELLAKPTTDKFCTAMIDLFFDSEEKRTQLVTAHCVKMRSDEHILAYNKRYKRYLTCTRKPDDALAYINKLPTTLKAALVHHHSGTGEKAREEAVKIASTLLQSDDPPASSFYPSPKKRGNEELAAERPEKRQAAETNPTRNFRAHADRPKTPFCRTCKDLKDKYPGASINFRLHETDACDGAGAAVIKQLVAKVLLLKNTGRRDPPITQKKTDVVEEEDTSADEELVVKTTKVQAEESDEFSESDEINWDEFL